MDTPSTNDTKETTMQKLSRSIVIRDGEITTPRFRSAHEAKENGRHEIRATRSWADYLATALTTTAR